MKGEPAPLSAVNETRDVVLAVRLEWAGDSETRRRGLLGRDSLEPGRGLWIVPCQWIHMFGMRFPIDAVFLDRKGKVVHVHEDLRPNRLSRPVPSAEGVLELPRGTVRATGTRKGDLVRFREDVPAPR